MSKEKTIEMYQNAIKDFRSNKGQSRKVIVREYENILIREFNLTVEELNNIHSKII